MAKPHDALFRETFGDPHHARALLRSALPPEIAELVDWDTLMVLEGTFRDPELREHQADLLFSVRSKGREVLIYVLVEHKSRSARMLAFHMLRYVVRIHERHLAANPGCTRLPPVLPIVVHHGRGPLRAPRNLRALVALPALPPALRDWLTGLQPELRIVVDDLAATDEAELRSRALTALGTMNLFCLQFVRGQSDDEALAAIGRIAELVRQVLRAPDGQEAMLRVLAYVQSVTHLTVDRLRPILLDAVGPPAEDLLMFAADRLRLEGRKVGRLEGRKEGRQEGRRDFVLRLFARRFGALPPALEAKLGQGSADDLERWVLRLLDAKSLDDVFSAP